MQSLFRGIGEYLAKSLPGSLSNLSVGITILLSSVSLAVLGQTAPAHAPLQISTPSNNGATAAKLAFAVAVEAGWLHPKSMDENFWLIHGERDGSVIASPINGLIYIRFTNLGDTPIMIDSYSIEVLEGNQKWVRLVTINAHRGEVYNRGPSEDMKQARRSNIEQDTFDHAIANRNIRTHETVRGWVFVEALDANLEGVKEARFNVTDSLGNKAVYPLNVLTGDSQSLQPRLLHVGETKDLSQARKQFYSEGTR
jgi:hypothetical protein